MDSERIMHFLHNMRALKDAESLPAEYEVIADSRMEGGLEYGPYLFRVWEFGDKSEGEERKLCLRTRERRRSSKDRGWETASEEGYYHGGGIPHELVALASIFLRRRFKLGPMVRLEDQPMLLSTPRRPHIDRWLVMGSSNLGELSGWFQQVENLDPSYHLKYILAARLYHRAILQIEEEPDLAYLNLISAIEVFSWDYDIGRVTLEDVDSGLAGLISSIENEDLRKKIEQGILNRERFTTRRFVRFVLDYVEPGFWEDERPDSQRGRVKDKKELEKLLKNVYAQRSATLHTGEPFPLKVFQTPLHNAEVYAGTVSVGDKEWKPKSRIPYPWFFEGLVNHVLKTFLKRHQMTGKKPTEGS